MKMSELANIYSGYIEVYEYKVTEDDVCCYPQQSKLSPAFYSDLRDILHIAPISETTIRVYVLEA
jgi:hypothetical protein